MKQVELVFIPATALSHIMAAVATAKLLLSRAEHRLSATVLIMNPTKDTTVETFILEYIGSRVAEVRRIISNIIQQQSTTGPPSQVAGLVLDLFTTNFIDVANEFGIPSYVFNPTSACYLALCLHPEYSTKSGSAGSDVSVPHFSVPVPAKVLPRRSDPEPRFTEIVLRFFERLPEVKGIVVNTFYEFESYAIDALTSDDKGPKVYAVGPVLNTSGGGGDEDVMKWLDDQPEKTVVFLCFGSMGSSVGAQVREIALALENGRFRFLWSLRDGAAAAALPEGFLERTKGVGRVIGWAVLAHAAVGGFVSHCGWNSILESVWFGIPVAAFPLFGDQHLNAFEVVEELKMAEAVTLDYVMDFTRESPPEIVGADEVEVVIRWLMAAEGSGVREKVKEMQKKARAALMEGGSSYNAQALFIQDIMRNITLCSFGLSWVTETKWNQVK